MGVMGRMMDEVTFSISGYPPRPTLVPSPPDSYLSLPYLKDDEGN